MQKERYGTEYHSVFHHRLLTNRRYYMFRAMYADKTYWNYFNNIKNGRFLEFGCGLGQNIFLHKKNTIGIDISDFARKKCALLGIKTEKSMDGVTSNSLDGILCCHVLEHLEEPAKYLREFLRTLKKGGILVLVLPVSSKNIVRPPDFKSWHLYSWTVQTIWTLLHYVGFKVRLAKFNYASGFSLFYKLPLPIAISMLQLTGRLQNQKEMIIVAEKP